MRAVIIAVACGLGVAVATSNSALLDDGRKNGGATLATDTLTADCRADWHYAGGAAGDEDPVHNLRSGNPHQLSSASPVRAFAPNAMLRRMRFAYSYQAGWGPAGVGTNFTVSVGGHPIYMSPHLTNYSYNTNRTLYSPPVIVDVPLSLRVNGSSPRILITFANNDRNLQLRLPLTFNVSCDEEPCLSPPLWEPPTRTVVFHGGDKDESGDKCPCFRIPALARAGGRLLAFTEARFHGCRPDVHPLNAVAMRSSDDNGTTWSTIRILARSTSPGGRGLNYPTPIVDVQRGVVHLFYTEYAIGSWRMMSSDGGKTWTTPMKSLHDLAMSGVQVCPLAVSPATLAPPSPFLTRVYCNTTWR